MDLKRKLMLTRSPGISLGLGDEMNFEKCPVFVLKILQIILLILKWKIKGKTDNSLNWLHNLNKLFYFKKTD